MILLCLLLLPWSTGLHEVAMGLALALACWKLRQQDIREQWLERPWAGPTVALAGLQILSGLLSQNRDGPGHAWLLAPLVAVPVLGVGKYWKYGLFSFAAAALVAAGLGFWNGTQKGLSSHHLTLAYLLLPPLGICLEAPGLSRRERGLTGVALGLGVLAAHSAGAMVAAAATLLSAFSRKPWIGLGTGVVTTLLLLPLADVTEQEQRALLWTGGLQVRWPAGEGGWLDRAIVAWDQLQPGFWFPYHAHDSLIQLWGVLGPAGLGALLWLASSLLMKGRQAGLVGVLVGAMTQNVFGDLEVARSVWMWAMVMIVLSERAEPSAGTP